jgi:hypothetical protein
MKILFNCKGYGTMSRLLTYILFSRKLELYCCKFDANPSQPDAK